MRKSGFIEGTIIATIAIVVTKIFGMLYVIPFCAIIGTKGSALYAYAYNIYIIFLDISSAGLPSAMSKITKEYQTLGLEGEKIRAYKIGIKIIFLISTFFFIILFLNAPLIAKLILGDIKGGNTIEDAALVIRCVSIAILIIPFLSVTKGYLQGHNYIAISSFSQVIEQLVRIFIMIVGSYIAIYIFSIPLGYSISIAVLGAFFGGLSALIYIFIKMKKANLKVWSLSKKKSLALTDREITKKILRYAAPFIIISIAASIYNFVDMVFISRIMTFLGYDASITEFVTSAVTTWSGKIGMVVSSVAMGLTVSLIPNIVEAYTLKDFNSVGNKLNKAMQIIIFTGIPMILGIIFLSIPVWSIFYGTQNLYLGASILSYYTMLCLFYNLYMITSSTLQSLNKFKLVFFVTIIGYVINIVFDLPLMLLCHRLGFMPYIGACISSVLGYSTSIIITLIKLKKEYKFKYKNTFIVFIKTMLIGICMLISIYLLSLLLKYNCYSKISSLIYSIIISLFGMIIYLLLSYKANLINYIFGKNFIKKVINKFIKF